MNSIKIASFNINGGLEKKLPAIKTFINTHQIDILLLQEVRLKELNITQTNKLFKPFRVYFVLGESKKHGNITVIQPKYRIYVIDATQSKLIPQTVTTSPFPYNSMYSVWQIRTYPLISQTNKTYGLTTN